MLVVQHQLVSTEYFMDSMQEWEAAEFYDVLTYAGYRDWEQTRLLLSCHVDHRKVRKLTDIIRFPWDPDGQTDSEREISNEQIEQLKKMSDDYIKNMK